MRLENAIANDVLERILSAYGFTMQKELSDRLEIAKSNVASWLARGQVPGNVIVQCAMDTGADVNWLVTGELEKASSPRNNPPKSGKALYEEILENGGSSVLRRILDAYGFTMQKQLCDLYDISSGTVSTWVRRNYFPGDVVVTCALDTGVSLQWLATGKTIPSDESTSLKKECLIPNYVLKDGQLCEETAICLDLKFIKHDSDKLILVKGINIAWVVDLAIKELSNGQWIINIDGKKDIYDLSMVPGRKVKVLNKNIEFTCASEDVEFIGKVVAVISQG